MVGEFSVLVTAASRPLEKGELSGSSLRLVTSEDTFSASVSVGLLSKNRCDRLRNRTHRVGILYGRGAPGRRHPSKAVQAHRGQTTSFAMVRMCPKDP
jgi:hypothetical protein